MGMQSCENATLYASKCYISDEKTCEFKGDNNDKASALIINLRLYLPDLTLANAYKFGGNS